MNPKFLSFRYAECCYNSLVYSTTKEIMVQLPSSVKSIYKKTKTDEFATLEKEIHQKFAEAERQCMAKLLAQYDWDCPAFISGDKTYRNKKSSH